MRCTPGWHTCLASPPAAAAPFAAAQATSAAAADAAARDWEQHVHGPLHDVARGLPVRHAPPSTPTAMGTHCFKRSEASSPSPSPSAQPPPTATPPQPAALVPPGYCCSVSRNWLWLQLLQGGEYGLLSSRHLNNNLSIPAAEVLAHKLFACHFRLPFPLRVMVETLDLLDALSCNTLTSLAVTAPTHLTDMDARCQADVEAYTVRLRPMTGAKSSASEVSATQTAPVRQPSSFVRQALAEGWLVWDDCSTSYTYNPLPYRPSFDPYNYEHTPRYRLLKMQLGTAASMFSITMPLDDAHFGDTGCRALRASLVGHHDRLVVVKTEAGVEGSAEGRRFDRLFAEGFAHAGRHYEPFLAKEEDRKARKAADKVRDFSTPVWFLATASMATEEAGAVFGSVLAAYRVLAAFEFLPSSGQLLARLVLAASPTVPVPVPACNIEYVEDMTAGSWVNGAEKLSKAIMNDGAGLISLNLCRHLPCVVSGRVVGGVKFAASDNVIQMRLYDPRYHQPVLSKGLLVPCAALPDNTIRLPLSMVKVPGRPMLMNWLQHQEAKAGMMASLEVVTSSWSTCSEDGARLNPQLLLLLGYGGVPRHVFEQMMDRELAKVADVKTCPDVALAAAKHLQKKDILQLLSSGIGTDTEGCFAPDLYLQDMLHRLQVDLTQRLREMHLPMDNSWVAVGVPDMSGQVPAGSIVLLGKNGAATFGFPALVYRHPGLHPGDIRRMMMEPPSEAFRAYYPTLADVVVFSTRGTQALAAQMAGGDYDGDQFVVIAQPDIVRHFQEREVQDIAGGNAAVMLATPCLSYPYSFGSAELATSLRRAQDAARVVSGTADLWKGHADRGEPEATVSSPSRLAQHHHLPPWGPGSPQCLELCEINYAALDAAKTGIRVNVPPHLRDVLRPVWANTSSDDTNDRAAVKLLSSPTAGRPASGSSGHAFSIVTQLFNRCTQPEAPPRWSFMDSLFLDPDLAMPEELVDLLPGGRAAAEAAVRARVAVWGGGDGLLKRLWLDPWRDLKDNQERKKRGKTPGGARTLEEVRHAIQQRIFDDELKQRIKDSCKVALLLVLQPDELALPVAHLQRYLAADAQRSRSRMRWKFQGVDLYIEAAAVYVATYELARQLVEHGGMPKLPVCWETAGPVLCSLKRTAREARRCQALGLLPSLML